MDLLSFAVFALITSAAHLFAYMRGFFHFPYGKIKRENEIKAKQIGIAFTVYFIITLLIGPLIARWILNFIYVFNPQVTSLSIRVACALQVALLFLILLFLLWIIGNRLTWVWKAGKKSSSSFDFGLGLSAWFLGFPLATIVGDLCDWILKHFFNAQQYEQTAVRFLKQAMQTPQSLGLALLTVILLAPLVEELLFRGLLQNYLRTQVGSRAAILLSALIFALFHFSPSQGLGNITIGFSLFTLGIYLGFLYERQQSLLASLGLHMSFNAISTLRIFFYPGMI